MNHPLPRPCSVWGQIATLITGAIALMAFCQNADGEVVLITNTYTGVVTENDATSGASINASFISGIPGLQGINIDGSTLLLTSTTNNTVRTFNANTGAVINSAFIFTSAGITPTSLSLSGNNLFVSYEGPGYVGEYNATTGAKEANPFFYEDINGSYPIFTADAGGILYVSYQDLGLVNAVSDTTGALLFSVSGLGAPQGVAVSGSTLYVSDRTNNRISTFDATTGALIN